MNYQQFANETSKLLDKQEQEWIDRYSGYYNGIEENKEYVEAVCKCFRPKAPITKYLSIGRVKDVGLRVDIDLRFMGCSIAEITVKPDKKLKERAENKENISEAVHEYTRVTFKENALKNIKDRLPKDMRDEFDEKIRKLNLLDEEKNGKWEWNSSELKKFRRFMKSIQNDVEFNEHMVETLFLRELNKRSGKGKYLKYIQPCKICGQYYQFVTPLAASDAKNENLNLSRKGGGIDILARKKRGNESRLCVIELKDKYEKSEPPAKAIKQAIAYAVFIIKLIRCSEAQGALWYKKIMGINKKLSPDEPIKINAVAAMPYPDENSTELSEEDTAFAKEKVMVGNDEIHLHYIFFKKEKEPPTLSEITASFM